QRLSVKTRTDMGIASVVRRGRYRREHAHKARVKWTIATKKPRTRRCAASPWLNVYVEGR
ncbi:MAG: hypothetical protein ACK2UI_01860, partial [Anaerolineae bacterium]